MEVLFVLGGFVFGMLFHKFISILFPGGALKIDHSNPEKDVYRFVIDDLDSLNKKKRILLVIDHNADLSDVSQK